MKVEEMKCLHVDKEITSALQDAILGHIAAADPQPAEAIEVFLKLCLHEDTNYPQFEEATMKLEDLGFITLLGHDCATRLFRLTENGRLYVSELITDALCAMSATGKIAEA
jgi:hypothetical protein